MGSEMCIRDSSYVMSYRTPVTVGLGRVYCATSSPLCKRTVEHVLHAIVRFGPRFSDFSQKWTADRMLTTPGVPQPEPEPPEVQQFDTALRLPPVRNKTNSFTVELHQQRLGPNAFGAVVGTHLISCGGDPGQNLKGASVWSDPYNDVPHCSRCTMAAGYFSRAPPSVKSKNRSSSTPCSSWDCRRSNSRRCCRDAACSGKERTKTRCPITSTGAPIVVQVAGGRMRGSRPTP